ncbi:hypothetical protein [Nocardia suismassiliense]|uniref:hypothetical protein n=1 Tax=Nocardia suismassiliense TaxID=2077092 RepID=UPI000D1EDE7A|nr:hypothetical protein [Nocardia suismassiliense]
MLHKKIRVSIAAVLVALTMLVVGCGEGDDPAPVTTSAAPDPTAAPARLVWETRAGVRLPRSPIDGPTNFGDAVATGYSRTPQGAVLAAIRGQVLLALATDSEWGRVLSIVAAPGPGREEYAANRIALSINGPVPVGKSPKFLAFKVTHYTDRAAAVLVVAETADSRERLAFPVALAWIDDWRIVLPTAAENVDGIEVPTLDGYTRLEG